MDNNAEKGDKWVYFKPLPVRKLIHELYNRVCEKEGQPHLSLDVLETLLIREGHGPVKDSFGRETERQYDFIEKINSVRLFIHT